MKKIILASSSPRRKELLEKIGLKVTVEPSDYVEEISLDLEPHELVKELSRKKAEVVAANHPNAIVIAADTLGVFRGNIVGKPKNEAEARKMLAMLAGQFHSVVTGFTIIDTDTHQILTKSVETTVFLKKLTAEEIDNYVKTKEPLGKAGAYAIQGLGSVIVERIEGDYYNVMGLPLGALVESLKEFGIYVL